MINFGIKQPNKFWHTIKPFDQPNIFEVEIQA